MKVLIILALAVAACSGLSLRIPNNDFDTTGRLQPGEVFSLTNVDRLRALASQPGATLILLAPGTPGGSLNLDAGGALRGGVLPLSTLDSIDSIRAILIGQPGARLILLFPSLAGSVGVEGTGTGTTSLEIRFNQGVSGGELIGVATDSSGGFGFGGGQSTTGVVFTHGGTVGTGEPDIILTSGPNAKYDHDRYWLEYDRAWHPMPYNFLWGVNAPDFGDIKYHKEKRVGEKVSGEYALVEPDGSLRTVTFTADDGVGFVANVKRTLNFAKPAPSAEHPWRVIVSNPPVSSDFGRIIHTTRTHNTWIPHPGVTTTTTTGGDGGFQVIRIPGNPGTPDIFKLVFTGGNSGIVGEFRMVQIPGTTTWQIIHSSGYVLGSIDLGTSGINGSFRVVRIPGIAGSPDTFQIVQTGGNSGILGGFQIIQIPGAPGTPATWKIVQTGGSSGTTVVTSGTSGTSTTNDDDDGQVIRIPGTQGTPGIIKLIYTGGNSGIVGEFRMVQIPGTTTWQIIHSSGSVLGTFDLGNSGINGSFKVVRISGTAGSADTWQIVQTGGSSGVLGGFQLVQIPGAPGTPATWKLVQIGGSSGTTGVTKITETPTTGGDGGVQVIRIPGTPGTPDVYKLVYTGGNSGALGEFRMVQIPGTTTWQIFQAGGAGSLGTIDLGASGINGGFKVIRIPGTAGSADTVQIVQTGGSSGVLGGFQLVQIPGAPGTPATWKLVRIGGSSSSGTTGVTTITETTRTVGDGDFEVIRIPGTPGTPDIIKLVYSGNSGILGEFRMVQIPGTTTWQIVQAGGSSGTNALGTIDLGASGINGGFKVIRIQGSAGSPDTFQIVQNGGSSSILGGFQLVQIPGAPGTPATWKIVQTGGTSRVIESTPLIYSTHTASNAGVGGPIGNSVSVNTPSASWGWGDQRL